LVVVIFSIVAALSLFSCRARIARIFILLLAVDVLVIRLLLVEINRLGAVFAIVLSWGPIRQIAQLTLVSSATHS